MRTAWNKVDKIKGNCLVCKQVIFNRALSIKQGKERKFCSHLCKSKFYTGNNHPSWKEDTINYNSIHQWLTKTFGKPTHCEKCGILGKRINYWNIQWALIKGNFYERKRENFWMLCVKCHRNYDNQHHLQSYIKNH